jgi:hypothetical protein
MTDNTLCNVRHKSSPYNEEFSLCDVCKLNGYPNQKVVFVIHGFRHEDEDGFAIKFTQYDYQIQNEKVHVHKCDEELVKRLVNESLAGVEVNNQ